MARKKPQSPARWGFINFFKLLDFQIPLSPPFPDFFPTARPGNGQEKSSKSRSVGFYFKFFKGPGFSNSSLCFSSHYPSSGISRILKLKNFKISRIVRLFTVFLIPFPSRFPWISLDLKPEQPKGCFWWDSSREFEQDPGSGGAPEWFRPKTWRKGEFASSRGDFHGFFFSPIIIYFPFPE